VWAQVTTNPDALSIPMDAVIPDFSDPKLPVDTVNRPRGVGAVTYRNIVSAAETAYRLKNPGEPLPTVDNIARFTSFSERIIVKVLASIEFRNEMQRRGITWTENARLKYALTPEMTYTIGVITNPTDRRPMAAKLRSAGVSYHIYRNWLRNPHFKEAVTKVAEDMIQDNIATAHSRLVQKVDAGDVQAIRLFYEVSGRHDPARQNNLDTMRLIGLLLEVMSRHITDPNTLNLISNDIDQIISGQVPQSITDVPANYRPSEALLSGSLVPHHTVSDKKTHSKNQPQLAGAVGTDPSTLKKQADMVALAKHINMPLPDGIFEYLEGEKGDGP
jgi:hypothetical protein